MSKSKSFWTFWLGLLVIFLITCIFLGIARPVSAQVSCEDRAHDLIDLLRREDLPLRQRLEGLQNGLRLLLECSELPNEMLDQVRDLISGTEANEEPSSDEVPQPSAIFEMRTGTEAVVYVYQGEMNLRSEPGSNSQVLTTIPSQTVVDVLEGPQEVEGLEWWKVRHTDAEEEVFEGWIVRRLPGRDYWSLVLRSQFLFCDEVEPPVSGQQAFVQALDDGLYLQPVASTQQQEVAILPWGSIVTVLDDEPQQTEGYIWWHVQVDQKVGWMVQKADGLCTLFTLAAG